MADMVDFLTEQAKHSPQIEEEKTNGKPADILDIPPFITEGMHGIFEDAECSPAN